MRGTTRVFYSPGILARVCLFFSILSVASAGLAQLSTASLSGSVRDSSGALVTNATIVLHSVDTSVERTSA